MKHGRAFILLLVAFAISYALVRGVLLAVTFSNGVSLP